MKPYPLNRVNASELSHAFAIARTLVAKTYPEIRELGKNQFICLALEEAAEGCKIERHVSEAAVQIIEQRLDGFTTVEEWLEKNVGRDIYKIDDSVQEYRHRWLDELVREFGEKAGLLE